jgi:hypothetical protein
VSLPFSDPVLGPALFTAIGIFAAAVVAAVGQIVCTWMETRSTKPSSRKPKRKPKKPRRRRLPGLPNLSDRHFRPDGGYQSMQASSGISSRRT